MKLTKQLSLFDFTIIMVSLVIGMGIFRTPSNVAMAVGSPAVFYAAWIVGGFIALCGALTYAEIGSRMPVTGGYYKVIAFAYHPSIAFAINCIILVSNAASLAAVALVGGEYITGVLIPASQQQRWISNPENTLYIQHLQIGIAICAVIIFYGLNLMGLKMSARAQNILTVIKILMVIALISPLFFAGSSSANTVVTHVSTASPAFVEYLKSFGIGLVAVSFTYGGYQQTINFGEEVVQPKKTIPRGIFFGIIIIILLYFFINYAYVNVIGFERLKTAKNIAAIMASKVFGQNAEKILSVLLFLSVLAYVNITLMSNPRVMAAMSDDNILPPAFKKRNVKTEALTTSLTVFSILCVFIIFWAKEFDTILSFTIFLDCFGMAFSAGSIFIIRKKTSYLDDSGIYIMKLYPLLPLIFIAAYVFVGISILVTNTKISLVGLAVLAAFIIFYFVAEKLKEQKNMHQ
ncbi:APC family permease [Hanamia caeni]|uniref:APC family permease n=1 Tax=Hanamia caeni TaxID=2294116 RepID=A0A3M9NMH9_9BACT|nr:APC family permease [Hanamia caeni]RNI38986.1 APC family permease [Hanamia caeni]